MLRLFLLLVLGAFGVWIFRNAEGMHRAIERTEAPAERIHLQGVEVSSFQPDGTLETRVVGEDAWLEKKLESLEIRPAKLEVYRQGVLETVLTSKIGRKLVSEAGDRFEFEGNVVGKGIQGRELYGELVHYDLKSRDFSCPQPATLIATDSRISGQVLQGNMDTRQGTVRGDVRLVYLERPAEGGPPRPLEITGEQADTDFAARHHRVEGQVHAVQGELDLICRILELFQDQETLIAVGGVRARDAELEITGERLEYRLDLRRALARGNPRVVQRRPGGEVQVLTALEVVASNPGKWMRGKGSVKLVSQVPERGALVTDTTILSDEVEAFYESGRATFKGNVRIESRTSSAQGANAVYYRDSRRVYVNGDAAAWEKDAQGREVHRVQGEHIVHHLDSGESVVLGGVHGYLQEGRK